MIHSSFVIAQYEKDFPDENEALGFGKTPLLFRLPTFNILSEIKPALWGYYFLDIERAFSWEWNFKIFPFLISSFLLLLLLTRNNFLISLFGSFWLFLSSAIQWWSINTELFTFGCLSLISFIYILFSDKPKVILANGLLFLLSAYSFVMIIYPPYQVPLAYLLVALLLGFFFSNRMILKVQIAKKSALKILIIGLCLAVLGILFYAFYHAVSDTIKVVADTVYPGKRNEKGGDFPFLRLFTDNFHLFMNEKNLPKLWINICESSAFLMLSPVAFLLLIYRLIRKKKISPLLISIFIFQLFLCLWIFVGLPGFLAKVTLLNISPPIRTFYILGFSNVVATLLFLSEYKKEGGVTSIPIKAAVLGIVFIAALGINYLLNRESDYFFSWLQVCITTAIVSCIYWTMIYFHEHKLIRLAFFAICFCYLVPGLTINPLSKGLSPYLENSIFKTLTAINAKDPDARWLVFGESTLANYLKAAGINCFNGVQYAPPLAQLHVLDPARENEFVYNRYAHIRFMSLFRGNDDVEFSLNQHDFYTIQVNPCSPKLRTIGIEYFLFTYAPDHMEIECMSYVKNPAGIYIYKRN